MAADEEGTLAVVQALNAELFEPKTAEYGGRIVKRTGDGTLIEFPSVVDAVRSLSSAPLPGALPTRQTIDALSFA